MNKVAAGLNQFPGRPIIDVQQRADHILGLLDAIVTYTNIDTAEHVDLSRAIKLGGVATREAHEHRTSRRRS